MKEIIQILEERYELPEILDILEVSWEKLYEYDFDLYLILKEGKEELIELLEI